MDEVTTSYFLERVEVDHTKLPGDLRVIDDRTGDDCGTAWVTIARDHYSGMVLALLVQFEGETLAVQFRCLRMIMSPKGFLKKLVPNLDYEFPSGVPTSFFFDRAAAADNPRIHRVGAVLDIRVDYAIGDDPGMKGTIERFIRIFKEECAHPIVGPKSKSYQEERDREPIVVNVPYSVLVRRLWTWATMIYAKTWHSGINDTPLNRYQQSIAGRLPRAMRKQDDLIHLLAYQEMCVIRRGTATGAGFTWKGEALRLIAAHPGYREGMLVEILFDEGNVADAWVVNPFTKAIAKLEPADPVYMTGLTVKQHDLFLKNLGRRKKAYNTTELNSERIKMMDEADALIRGGKSMTGQQRATIADFRGIGRRQPVGDDLGDVEAHPDAAATANDTGFGEPAENAGEPDAAPRLRRATRRRRGDQQE